MTNTQTAAATQTPLIFQSLINMQTEISVTGISKSLSATDKTGKELYKARGIDAVYNLLSPLFCKHGVVVGFTCLSKEREAVQGKYNIQYQTFVTVEYTFTSAQDGSMHKVTVIGEAFDHSDKGIAKALSMAFKYACFQVFCIPVCDDPDSIVHEQVSNNDYQDSRQNTRTTNTQLNNGNQGQQQQRNQGQQQQRNQGQQQQNNQGQQQYISQEQFNELVNTFRVAAMNPEKLLTRYKIAHLGELKVADFQTVIASVRKYIQEQQQINQQGNNQQYDNRQGNYS